MSSKAQAGQRIGEYVLKGPLGEGGFATVWQASHHMWPERRVAAKLLKDADRAPLLKSEAEVLGQLEHAGIVQAIGLDLQHDPPYLLLELHEGRTLRGLMRDTSLSPERTLAIFRQLVDALAHAHRRGVAHGDLKPENVLIDHADTVKLTDFGLGTQITSEASLMLSGKLNTVEDDAPHLAGTIPYMAPEQREGQAPDPTSDVFSLGILLHEMLTGRRPQPGDDPREGLRDPPAWLAVWERCFTRRDKRLRDAGEVARAMDAILSGEPPAIQVRAREGSSTEHERPLPPEPRRPQPVRIDARTGETLEPDRQRLVLTNRDIDTHWSLEQIEQVVAQEAGVRITDLRHSTTPEGTFDRLVHWAENHLLGDERELQQARAMVWFFAHEFCRMPVQELAERYQVEARTVAAGIRLVQRRRVPHRVWQGIVRRLAVLPQPLVQEAEDTEPGPLRAGGAALALMAAVTLLIPGLAALAAGKFALGVSLLALAGSATYGGTRLLSPSASQERWVEDHLDQLPGEDRRAKLARLAVNTELRGLSKTARHMLSREPIEVKVRAKDEPKVSVQSRPARATPAPPSPEARPTPLERARARQEEEAARQEAARQEAARQEA
ncbi:MAG TPA: hypothetical protein DEA08_27140, partial [Planctomycetes bacterium]|nr:hypothetical protein [Planctomycetota bacterium]